MKIEDFNLDDEDPIDIDISNDKDTQQLQDDNLLVAELKIKWQEILSQLQKLRAALASHLLHAVPFSSCGNLIKIAFSKKDSYHKEVVANTKNLEFIKETISKFMNKDVGVKFILIEDTLITRQNNFKEKEVEAEGQEDNLKAEAQDNEFINQLLDTFGGRLSSGND